MSVEGFVFKERYTLDDLLNVVRILRSPGGCPWDIKQTHESIRGDFLEETHEVLEAISSGDNAALCEELGDVLLQVVFHAQIAQEDNVFTFDEVADGICRKLIIRHPHVFDSADGVDNPDDVLRQWDVIKRRSAEGKTHADLLRSLPRSLPALMRAAKVQQRAARAGFDWDDVSGAIASLDSEVCEMKDALASGRADDIEDELGDILFSTVNVSRFVNCDAEQTLIRATDKFIRRFDAVEKLAAKKGLDMSAVSIDVLDKLWEQVKSESE